jgi:hypothetical protein
MADAGPNEPMRWRRSATELTVIALGVFLGLAADASWDARQETITEISYLHQLYGDVLATQADLDRALAYQANARRNGELAIDGINSRELPPSDSLASWIWTAGATSVFEPAMGTLTALVQTGDIRLLRNEELGGVLLRHQQVIDHFHRQSDRYENHRLSSFRDLGRAMSLDVLPAQYGSPQPLLPVDWASAVRDPVLHSSVFNLVLAAKVRLDLLTRSQASLDEVHRVLLEELSGRGEIVPAS